MDVLLLLPGERTMSCCGVHQLQLFKGLKPVCRRPTLFILGTTELRTFCAASDNAADSYSERLHLLYSEGEERK